MNASRMHMNTMDEVIIRVLRGEAEPIDERRLAHWRAEAAQNDVHFEEVSAIWRASEDICLGDAALPAAPAVESIVRRGDALRRREERLRFARGLGRRDVWPWAAAAAIATVSFGIWLGGGGGVTQELVGTEFVAGSLDATTVALSDGSFVRLDAGSSVRFTHGGDTREAWLSGRAFFGVAADPERPFVVHTDLGSTTVLGTRFEVRSRDDELRVIVVEGRVAVTSAGGRSSEVSKGQVATLATNGDFSVTTVDDVYALLDWEGGLLVFQGTPLAQVAEEVGAHFGLAVVVSDELASRTLTAWFGDDQLAEVVESICLLVRAECETSAAGVRIGR